MPESEMPTGVGKPERSRPAGWGKITLLAQWAHYPAETRAVAWVSFDPSDDEPIRFW